MKERFFSSKLIILIIILFTCLFLFSTTSLALIPGDFSSANNGPPDGVVDFEDLMIFAIAYGSTLSDPNWNLSCDIAGPEGSLTPDGVIDFEDLMLFALHYGEQEQITPERVVMVELFAATWCPFCARVEPPLEQLAEEYGPSQVILLEEHIWDSDYQNMEAETRYYWYPLLEDDRGIPDVLFNGLNQRIVGAPYGAYENYKKAIEAERVKETKIYISVSKKIKYSTITISGNIKNVSSSPLSSIIINGMIFEDRGEVGLRYLVLDIFNGKTINLIAADETVSFSFTSEELNCEDINNVHGVIFVQAFEDPGREILQALYIE
jgi:thiol-disulfide isomerase/thioredoxin